ncbi:3-hydroxyacyl-CoA dehydrogenase family protein [Roseobacter sinensis]|uniref:3-hydroxyacyl-CoA dehydrogenase family protein n=1 Tax=Roseobacter sinensis TaxID=2931391 RepID=A0ABT3BDX9_9RHOB|nr:3-hydroxyacyl-CoA dehydrogenase family protein [Roseobacter sp. WL0113]MCV3271760.1 3-hydroxyacyl-CoA dehydrogenase family protein [Roseobacter sp. WL0113]
MTSDIAARLAAGLDGAADQLLFEATTPWDLDAAMTDFGFETGVCAAQDIAGLDRVHARIRAAGETATPVLPRMVAEGRLGRTAGVGWYRYPGGGGLVIDPLVEDLLREEARFAGVSRRDLSDDILIARLLLGLAKAALALLRAGADAALIDRVSQRALGFPAAHGGVLSYLRTAAARLPETVLGRLSEDERAGLLHQP